MQIYEEKDIPTDISESEQAMKKLKEKAEYINELLKYDVISFDIFDTLLLRPFSEPADLFYFVGLELEIMDFKRIRMEQEALAREECYREKGHYEVGLLDIWKRMEQQVGIDRERGMKAECDMELQFCYVNPFMQAVYREIIKAGKRVILISDMYLPGEVMERLLEKNGFYGYEKLYISCEYGCSKADGRLFEKVREDLGKGQRFIHAGDNEYSDVRMAEKAGFKSCYYPNVNKMALSFRPYDMSPVIGAAYRGIVDNYLYQGCRFFSMEYEYGFVYGGLFVLGYCDFIHDYCRKNCVDKVLFLSRDGDILKKVYDRRYPEDNTAYVYWSRTAAVKLMAKYNRYDYFRRYLYHKMNRGISIAEVLEAMELEEFVPAVNREMNLPFRSADELTDRNVEQLKEYLLERYGQIIEKYEGQMEAAKRYYGFELEGIRHAVAVDIGWAGSGALSLAYLAENIWGIPCKITGIVAGTNTIHNGEPDTSEIFLQSGRLVSYLFSQAHNRDVMKKHNPNKDYNVYWELLLSSPTRQFLGFEMEGRGGEGDKEKAAGSREKENHIYLRFGKKDINQEGICQIQKGIFDFAEEYEKHFASFPYMFRISGRDACAPMLLAAGHNEKYLKSIAGKFSLEIDVKSTPVR